MDICDRASSDHDVAYTAIEQVAKHGKILDQHVRDHPHVKDAFQRGSNLSEDLEELCWNHYAITVTDKLCTSMHVARRKEYKDIWAILMKIWRMS